MIAILRLVLVRSSWVAALTLAMLAAQPAAWGAAPPGSVIVPGKLLWGGDQEGGGPYVYPAEDDPSRVVGFEVDLAARLASHFGLEATFFQGPWDRMPELVRTGKCDIILNGYEWSPYRLGLMDASIPYYVYALQLLARRGGDVRSWSDLPASAGARRRRVGVLGGSAAEAYLASNYPSSVELVSYDGSTDAMREVETGKLDATLQDSPAASFYATRFPGLAAVDAPVGHGYYVAFARKGSALIPGINVAIGQMAASGELEAIYRRYGIWNDRQKEIVQIASAGRFYGSLTPPGAEGAARSSVGGADDSRALAAAPRGFAVVASYGGILLRAAGLTALLSCVSFPLASVLGLAVALGRLYGPRSLRAALAGYVEFLRGTPLMLQLYFVFFVLPEVGINVPAFWTAVLGLAINYSAYESEIYRAGISAVPRGQMEAALALGMSRPLALRRIIVPQALRVVLPPAVNDFIALFKDTSVCSVITLVELTKRFSVLSQSTQATIELMVMTGLLYLTMSYPLSVVAQHIERRLGRSVA